MKKAGLTRYRLWLFLVASLALVGLVWAHPNPHPNPVFNLKTFSNANVHGRFVSAETAYDISSVHAFSAAANSSNVGPPIFFAATAVMNADGAGNVCGESDGFYSLGTAGAIPGINLGPSLFHGTFSVESTTGRITINTCSDGAPTTTNTFCGTSTACSPVTKTQVGYLQDGGLSPDDEGAKTITTVEQVSTANFSSGFLVHHRVWTKHD